MQDQDSEQLTICASQSSISRDTINSAEIDDTDIINFDDHAHPLIHDENSLRNHRFSDDFVISI